MTSSTESVKIVEVTWKIPKFGEFLSSRDPLYYLYNAPYLGKVVFIGGRLPPAYSQSKSPPVKLEVSVSKVDVLSEITTQPLPQTRFGAVAAGPEIRPIFGTLSARPGLPQTRFGTFAAEDELPQVLAAAAARREIPQVFGTVVGRPELPPTFGALAGRPGLPQTQFGTFANRADISQILAAVAAGPEIPPVSERVAARPKETYQWRFNLKTVSTVSNKSQPPSPCILRGKFLEFKILDCETGHTLAEGVNGDGDKVSIDLREPHHEITLFDHKDADGFVDKRDGSLNIYFKMEVTCSCPEPNGGLEFTELLIGFESLLKNPANSDVEIKVSQAEGQSFKCHKGILAGRSEVFRAMFASDMKESKDNVVEVEDILPKAMEHFLSFVYCGRFADSSWIRLLPQLAYAADKYCVKSLKEICELHLSLSVTCKNAFTLGILAERHGLTKAVGDIRKFIAQHAHFISFDPDCDTSCSDTNFVVCYSVPSQENCGPESTPNN